MAAPQVSGSRMVRSDVGGSSATLDISSVPVGGWMVVSVMCSAASNIVNTPAGWTVLHAAETTGTRRNYLFAKKKDGVDGATVIFTQNGTTTTAFGLVWGTGGGDIGTWVVGTSGLRSASSEPTGSRYTNTAPSLTTTSATSLVLAVSNEATLAQTATYEVASYTAGWTERLWFQQVAPNDRIETIWIGSKEYATAGATGDVQVAYISPQDTNGWGIQVAIPPAAAPVPLLPQVIGTPSTFIGGAVTTSFTVNRPSGILDNDYIVVVVRGQSSTTTVQPASAGFTRLGPAFTSSSSTYRTNGIYGRPVTNAASEPSSYTFSMTASSGRLIAVSFVVRNVDLNNPVSGFSNSYGGNTITGGRRVDSYTVATNPSLALFFGASEFSATYSHVPTATPTGYTQIASIDSGGGNIGTSRTYVWLGTKEINSLNTGDADITWGTPSGAAAEGVAFNGVASDPVDTSGSGVVSYDGNGDQVAVYYTTASGPRTPSDLIPMRRGFDSVAQMLATPGFTWAHRGGSASYPEHSLYAYTQSVARGYGVLEVSMGRTSDGVWFGLHDQTTDRTSGGTYGNASSQTWAQIQAQQIVVGAQGAPQPYMSWNELVSIYGDTHIFVVDPKYALGSYRTEFLNMIDATVGPTRAIIKYSGVGSGAASLSTNAQARGYQTWGFFYASDASAAQGGSGALQTWAPSWTLLGMEYGASQAIWDEVLAFNKPIIGHIAPNQTAYDTAMSKGASGVQVSGVGVVAPVSWWTQ